MCHTQWFDWMQCKIQTMDLLCTLCCPNTSKSIPNQSKWSMFDPFLLDPKAWSLILTKSLDGNPLKWDKSFGQILFYYSIKWITNNIKGQLFLSVLSIKQHKLKSKHHFILYILTSTPTLTLMWCINILIIFLWFIILLYDDDDDDDDDDDVNGDDDVAGVIIHKLKWSTQ